MRAHILSASAGSGKTYRLAYKFVHDTIKNYHTKPYLYRAILAVTFTNKATEEMKSRILREINTLIVAPSQSSYMSDLKRDLSLTEEQIVERARGLQAKILHDYSRFTVLTIDKFFQRILRAFIKELGIDLNYNNELDTTSVLARSTDSLIEEIPTNDELRRWMTEFIQEHIDQNKDWDLRKDMNALGKDIFNESSKQTIEKALSKDELRKIINEATASVAKLRAESKSLAQKAIAIMDEAGVVGDDFTYKAGGFINTFSIVANGGKPTLGVRVRNKASSPEGWSKVAAAQALAPQLCPMLARIVELFDEIIPQENTLNIVKAKYRSYALLQDIYRKVLEECNREGIMLLSETKYILSRFVEKNDAPFIYEKTGNRFERFMIDEFQDTSLKEWSNFVPLLRNAMAQEEETSVLIVGDVKQSIYRWRGGDWRILQQGVSEALGEADTYTEFMKDNYRSAQNIVSFNNKAIDRIIKADNAVLNKALDQAKSDKKLSAECHDELYNTLERAYTSHEQNPKLKTTKQGYVRIEKLEQDAEPPIIEYIESAIARGYSYKDILILCRSKGEIAQAAAILLKYKERNNNFNIMTQESLVIGSASVSSFIIAAMRLSQNMSDTISLAILNDYLGRAYNQPLEEREQQLLASISQLSPEQAFEHIVEEYRLGERRDDIAFLQALHEQVVSFCSSKVADITLFLKMWDESGEMKSLNVEKSDSTIELLTIHTAKGLEKEIVIIPYCSWRLDPQTYDNTVWATPDNDSSPLSALGRFPVNYTSQMASAIFANEYYRERVYAHVEAINLLYVALTRAKEELYVSIPYKDPQFRHVGSLLWDAVKEDAKSIEQTSRCYAEYGQADAPAVGSNRDRQNAIRNILLDNYPTSEAPMSLRFSGQRYFKDGGDRRLSARNMGILMHSVLSEATTIEDINKRIDRLQKDGRIAQSQAEELHAAIEREFSREQVREWFGEWDDVRCESDILCTHEAGTRRPDRVMIRDGRVVVVDYKFGEEQSSAHKRQMRHYIELLTKMGYEQVEGYLWYLMTGEIVKIDN